MDSNPKPEEIVSDEVDFYAQTVLKVGIEEAAWSKYGNTKLTNIEKAQEVLFSEP